MTDASDVRDNPAEHRFEVRVGDAVAFLQYLDKSTGQRSLVHTEVPPAFEGQGVGSRLVRAALEDARSRGVTVIPVCPFVRTYLSRHPDYADLIDQG